MVCEGRPSTPCALEAVAKAWMPAFAGMTVVRRRARYFHAHDAEATMTAGGNGRHGFIVCQRKSFAVKAPV
jgi:hypothetical protein